LASIQCEHGDTPLETNGIDVRTGNPDGRIDIIETLQLRLTVGRRNRRLPLDRAVVRVYRGYLAVIEPAKYEVAGHDRPRRAS
jgi:hypothetical protein